MPSAAKSNNDSAVQRPSSLPSDLSGIDSLPKPIEPDADRVRSFNYFEHHILTIFFDVRMMQTLIKNTRAPKKHLQGSKRPQFGQKTGEAWKIGKLNDVRTPKREERIPSHVQ